MFKKMNEQNQINKTCCACGHEREYDNYHIIYVACKKSASIRYANYYQKNREKILEKSRFYRENNEDKIKRKRKNIDTHTEDLQNLYNQIRMLTQMVKSTTLVT